MPQPGGRFFANCDRPPANCVHFMSLSRRNAASESKERPWRVIRNQKTYRQNRMGCGRISQRAAQGSLYRGAGRQRRSERLKVGPYAQGHGRVFFCELRPATCGLRLFHESIAVKPHLNLKKAMHGILYLHAWPLYHKLNPIFLKEFFTKTSISSRFVRIVVTLFIQQSLH